jgi:hypothetical protein
MSKKIKVRVSTGLTGSERTAIITVEDDNITEAEAEELALEKMWEMIDFSFELI